MKELFKSKIHSNLCLGVSLVSLAYISLFGFLAVLYDPASAKWIREIIAFFSIPANFWLDLPIFISSPLNLLIGYSFLISLYGVMGRFLGKNSSLSSPFAAKVEDLQPHLPIDFELGTKDREFLRTEEAEEKEEVPQYIQNLVTRFVDIHTLQPVGVLRSVLVLLDADFGQYTHLLRTKECQKSIERLQNLPNNFFKDKHCMELLRHEKAVAVIYQRLNIPLERLHLALLEKIQDETSKIPVNKSINHSFMF